MPQSIRIASSQRQREPARPPVQRQHEQEAAPPPARRCLRARPGRRRGPSACRQAEDREDARQDPQSDRHAEGDEHVALPARDRPELLQLVGARAACSPDRAATPARPTTVALSRGDGEHDDHRSARRSASTGRTSRRRPTSFSSMPMPMRLGGVPTGVAIPPIEAPNDVMSIITSANCDGRRSRRSAPGASRSTARSDTSWRSWRCCSSTSRAPW